MRKAAEASPRVGLQGDGSGNWLVGWTCLFRALARDGGCQLVVSWRKSLSGRRTASGEREEERLAGVLFLEQGGILYTCAMIV